MQQSFLVLLREVNTLQPITAVNCLSFQLLISVAKGRGRSSDSEEKRLPGSRGISPDIPIKIANPNLKSKTRPLRTASPSELVPVEQLSLIHFGPQEVICPCRNTQGELITMPRSEFIVLADSVFF